MDKPRLAKVPVAESNDHQNPREMVRRATQAARKCGALLGDLESAGNVASRDKELPGVACDPSLAEVVDRWPALPEAIRLAILALVRTAS